MFKRLIFFFKRLFGYKKQPDGKETLVEHYEVVYMEAIVPVPAHNEPDIPLSFPDNNRAINDILNENAMTTEYPSDTTFSSGEPLINDLTAFLASRLQQLVQNDDSGVTVPPVPDWEHSGSTLSQNFSRFIRSLNLKRKEEAQLEEAGLPAPAWNESQSGVQITEHEAPQLTTDEKWILVIALVPHIYPHFYDEVILRHLQNPGEYPQLGFTRGKDFRGYIPTGETAFFLLAGNDFDRRLSIQQLFQGDHFFARRKIVWLEELVKGEPVMSGKIILSQDHLDTIMFGRPVPPAFSMNFPAKQIRTALEWEDLVINEDLKEQISDIKNWLQFNDELENQWGMKKRLRQGYRTLFYGPSGTGKTLSAGLLGKEMKKDVYKIDLSMVVSKYIGETEKNLELLFARAEDKGWILFFDEADALFGKRTSVRDAHDKYANQEVSYLLQRIEDYNGLVILATNMKNNIDDAFIRRFNSVLKFPFPSADERSLIWRKSFPPGSRFYAAPLEDNMEEEEKADIPQLVKKYELTGGSIINIVHYAGIKAVERLNERRKHRNVSRARAVMADTDGRCIEVVEERPAEPELAFYLSDVLDGIRRELIKEGKPFAS